MKRRELARLTGYCERHISRIAGEIPGATSTSGGQCNYDETNPEFKQWLSAVKAKNEIKRHLKHSGAKKRKSKMPTMAEDMAAVKRFVDAFKKAQEIGAEIRLTRIGAKIPDGTSKEQWLALGEMLKHLRDIPSGEGILLLLHHFEETLPESLSAFFKILQLPIFADFWERDDGLREAIQIRKESGDSLDL